MTVLVTGGAGYIGGHMTLGLLDGGENVVVLDNLSTGFDWAVPEAARLVVGDIGDAGLVARLIDEHAIDAIAHFAAKIVVPESVADPLGYYLNNTSNARTLIETAIMRGVRAFIFSSTAAVYGETSCDPVSEGRATRVPVRAPINQAFSHFFKNPTLTLPSGSAFISNPLREFYVRSSGNRQ